MWQMKKLRLELVGIAQDYTVWVVKVLPLHTLCPLIFLDSQLKGAAPWTVQRESWVYAQALPGFMGLLPLGCSQAWEWDQCTEFTPFPGPHLHRGCHSQILSWGLNLVLTSKLPTFEVLRFRLALRSRKQSVRIGGCLRAIRDSHFNKIVEFHHPKFHRKSASIQEDLIRTTLTSLECALIIYQGPRLNHLPKGQMGALPSSNYVFLAKVLNHCLPFLLCKMSDSKNSVNQIQVLPLETSLAHDGC